MKTSARLARKSWIAAVLGVVALALGGAALPASAAPASAAPTSAAPTSVAPASAPPTSAASAAGDEFTWAVQPSSPQGPGGRDYFVLSATPGQEMIDYVGISNVSSKDIEFKVYATDAFTTKDGAFSLLAGDAAPTDVGLWVGFDSDRYTVPAGKRLDIPFRITVPADAAPGDHIGGVVAAVAATETSGDGSQQLTVDRRVGARIYLRVAGPALPSLKIKSIHVGYSGSLNPFGPATVTYEVTNDGNVRLEGVANVRVVGPFGTKLGEAKERQIGELLPRSSVTVTETIPNVFAAGRISAQVSLEPVDVTDSTAALKTINRASSVWAMPWLVLIVVALVAALVVFLVRRRKRGSSAGAPVVIDLADGATESTKDAAASAPTSSKAPEKPVRTS